MPGTRLHAPGSSPVSQPGDDWVDFARDANTGIETIRAHFTGHAYDPHFHDAYLVGVTEQGLQSAHRAALERGLTASVYVGAMFATGNDEANRAALRAENPEDLDLVGLALRGDRKQVDKAVKGLSLHK